MEKLKQWVALAVAASRAIVAGGWFLLISPKKGEAEELRAAAAQQVADNATLETALSVLRAQAKDLPKKQADLARVSALIPDNPSLPSLIRAVSAASTAAGVDFVSIQPGVPEAPPAPVAVVVEPPPTSAQTAPTAPTAPVPPVAGASAAGTLTTIPLTLNVVGDYYDVAQFLSNVEELLRALRMVEVTVSPGLSPTDTRTSGTGATDGKSLITVLKGKIFMAVNRPAPTVVTVPVVDPAK